MSRRQRVQGNDNCHVLGIKGFLPAQGGGHWLLAGGAVGVAQEFRRVGAVYQRDIATAAPQFTFAKPDRRVICW
jgi:hypothetical protein